MSSQLAPVSQIYSRNPKLKKEDVDAIFAWLETQPHLPRLTELQVILFLHSCYHELEPTKATIDHYFTLRTNFHLFRGGDEALIRRVQSSFFLGILPEKTPKGFIILLFKIFDPSPEKLICDEFFKMLAMVVVLYCHQHGPVDGLVILCDADRAPFGYLFRLSVFAVKQILQFLQEAAPTRLKGIHYVNTVPVLKHLIALAKPFLKKEIYESMTFHSPDIESLYEHIPKRCLPIEYGGELGRISELHEKNLRNLIASTDFFHWHDSQRVDNTKRKKK